MNRAKSGGGFFDPRVLMLYTTPPMRTMRYSMNPMGAEMIPTMELYPRNRPRLWEMTVPEAAVATPFSAAVKSNVALEPINRTLTS